MLTNAAVKAARPRARAYKVSDGQGLFLFVAPTGLRSWRMKFRYHGREQLLTFGTWPDVSLDDARGQLETAREQLRRGINPAGARRAVRSAPQAPATFAEVARAWHARRAPHWSTVHAGDVLASLERDVFPAIGATAIADVTEADVLALLERIEARGRIETARRIRQRVSAVFGFAIRRNLVPHNPAATAAEELQPRPPARRQPALTELEDAHALIEAVSATPAPLIVKLASTLLALTAVRLEALRGATWDEFESIDWTGTFVGPQRPLWRVPAARMKLAKAKKADADNDHLVPLSAAAVSVLRAIRGLQLPGEFVLSSRNGRPIGENALRDLYRRAGFGGRHVPHGWRATFATVMNERYPADREVIDQALAHVPKDKVEAAYNRAQQLGRRRAIFNRWADLLLVRQPSACPDEVGAARSEPSPRP